MHRNVAYGIVRDWAPFERAQSKLTFERTLRLSVKESISLRLFLGQICSPSGTLGADAALLHEADGQAA